MTASMSQHERVAIIAGGYSARRHNLNDLGCFTIGVNDSAIYIDCDIICSMDRLWVEGRWNDMLKMRKPSWLRRATLKQKYQYPTPEWITVFECDYKTAVMSDEPLVCNGTNSGLCAVNLGYKLRPVRLELYGLDGSRGPRGEAHWYDPYPWRKSTDKGTAPSTHAAWQRDLAVAIKQCRVAGIDVVMK